MDTFIEVAGICVAALMLVFLVHFLFGHEPDPMDSTDLQARREFERKQARDQEKDDKD